MARDRESDLAAWGDVPELVRKIRARTPARLLAGRSGAAYRTSTQMELREAHAAARDAVRQEMEIGSIFDSAFVSEWNLFEVETEAANKHEYLMRPDLGRRFSADSIAVIRQNCPSNSDLQIAIGDGLSVPAVATQVPGLLPLICAGAQQRGWTVGRTFVIRHCRVGILNEIGEVLRPRVALLLIGERPGLATADSLSAYMAHRPKTGDTDANRNLISNIHSRGLHSQAAAERILNLAQQMTNAGTSGYILREEPRSLH